MPENIQFETDQQQFRPQRQIYSQPQSKGMAAWLVRKGLISDESQAGNILVGVVALNFILTAIVIYFFIL